MLRVELETGVDLVRRLTTGLKEKLPAAVTMTMNTVCTLAIPRLAAEVVVPSAEILFTLFHGIQMMVSAGPGLLLTGMPSSVALAGGWVLTVMPFRCGMQRGVELAREVLMSTEINASKMYTRRWRWPNCGLAEL